MELRDTQLPGVKLLTPRVHSDDRGFFLERWRANVPGLPDAWAQVNHSRSRRGVLRGLHYQLEPHAQGKLVGVVRGRILDVAVDLRRGSPTFGRHVAVELDDVSHQQLWVPRGFAHGFLVLSDVADVIYKVDRPYHQASERGVRWDDPTLAIGWSRGARAEHRPPSAQFTPLVSEKDAALPYLAGAEHDFTYP